MGQVSNDQVIEIFKKVYGKATDLLPEDYMMAKDIPFTDKQKVGEEYIEAVTLTNETGWTLGGSAQDAFELEPANAGATKQISVKPYISALSSIIPWGTISRSVGAGAKSFYDATKLIVKNNLKSHGKLCEIMRLYGQSENKLGAVSYASATYRGVSLTNGSGTISVNGTDVVFTNGVNTAEKMILFQPGEFAAGIWVGLEGAKIQQIVKSSGVVVAEGKITGMDVQKGVLVVDFVPVAATAEYSHVIGIKGMAETKEQIGIRSILEKQSGALFGVNVNQYALWKSNYKALSQVKFTYDRLNQLIAEAVNRGGLDGEVSVYLNPHNWATVVNDQSAARSYDSSYSPSQAEEGFEAIRYHSQNGGIVVKSHRMLKEGDAMILSLPEWSRSGSAEVSFQVPGMNKDIIFPLENQAGYMFRSYADQYVFCNAPGRQMLLSGLNFESAS